MNKRTYMDEHDDHAHFLSNDEIMTLRKNSELSTDIEKRLRTLRLLSDATKFRIYSLLHNVEEIAVSDIAEIVGLSQSATSHALSDMKQHELVDCNRCGQLICYKLTNHAPDIHSLINEEGKKRQVR